MLDIGRYVPDLKVLGIPARHIPQAIVNVRIILHEFTQAGLPLSIALAAVVNAYAESRFDHRVRWGQQPWAGEDSAGLFQLNAARGAAGEGMTLAQRQDATLNTRRIIEVVKGPSGERLRRQARAGATIARLTEIFTVDIERPANAVVEGATRAGMARRLYPGLADQSAHVVDRGVGGQLAKRAIRVPWWGWLAGGIGVIVLPLLFFMRR